MARTRYSRLGCPVMKDKQILPECESAGASFPGQTDPPQRILVAEDDGDIRRLNAKTLRRSGYVVDVAEDGAAAWVALQTNHYDLLLTDNSMPKVTGVELLEMLRSARMALPVILATGVMTENRFTRYPRLEPTATLPKPYTVEELLAAVKRVLPAVEISPVQVWQSEPPVDARRL